MILVKIPLNVVVIVFHMLVNTPWSVICPVANWLKIPIAHCTNPMTNRIGAVIDCQAKPIASIKARTKSKLPCLLIPKKSITACTTPVTAGTNQFQASVMP